MLLRHESELVHIQLACLAFHRSYIRRPVDRSGNGSLTRAPCSTQYYDGALTPSRWDLKVSNVDGISTPRCQIRTRSLDEKLDDILMDLSQHPCLLYDAIDKARAQGGGASTRQTTQSTNYPTHIMAIRVRRSKRMIARAFIIFLSIGLLLGIVVGLCSRRADVGIELSAALFTLTACLQGLVVLSQD